MKLTCPTTLGEGLHFSKEKLLFREVIILTDGLIRSLSPHLDFIKTKFDWDREDIGRPPEGLY